MENRPPKDSRNPENRLHLNFGYKNQDFNPQAKGSFPVTPSTFPQPAFKDPISGQREIWGTDQQPPTSYAGGPPSYFVQNVQYEPPQQQQQYANQAQFQQSQQPAQIPAYRSPLGTTAPTPAAAQNNASKPTYNDGTNGLINQFSHQNLGGGAPQAQAQPQPQVQKYQIPAARQQQQQQQQQQPGSRPRTANSAQALPQYGSHLAPQIPGVQNGAVDDETPARDPDKYAANVVQRSKLATELVATFFRDSVQRARDRNTRYSKDLELFCADPRNEERKKHMRRSNLDRSETAYLRFLRTKEKPENFTIVKVIGKGAFGEVKLVKRTENSQIYALKSLVKSEMFKRDQLAHVRSERDILAESDSPWVVKLHTTFQDSTFLYMLMEFLPGGDLMTMLIKYEIFSEDITRFYMAQLTLAIEAVHKLNFIHRDIKPDNILLDKGGHIKLTDFGLSTGFHKEHDQSYYQQLLHGKPQRSNRDNRQSVTLDQIQLTVSNRNQINTWRKSRRQLAYSTVGTPDYIAPEIFTGKGYDFGCDWWSVGTIAFECLIGWPPFCAEESTDTYRKIVDWPRHLHFPPDQQLSPNAEDFVRSLINDADRRLGHIGGATEIKRHPFFRGVDWNILRKIRAPFEPKLTSSVDTQYFPVDEIPQEDNSAAIRARDEVEADQAAEMSLPFVGYTYKRFDAFRSS